MSIDPVSAIALIVSLVALLVALLQVIQQYASTAYDYRRCSTRTMGGWATKYTKRHFIWSEVRFEITFAVPHLQIDWDYQFCPKEATYRVITPKQSRSKSKQADPEYSGFLGGDGYPPRDPAPRKDTWFLDTDGSVPEAACSWLQLLQDSSNINLPYRITVKRHSFDYLPREVTRPLATAELGTFLALLSVIGVQWEGRGADGKFMGRVLGENISVTATDIPSVGRVYTYTNDEDALSKASLTNTLFKPHLPISEQVQAMFNSFRLGFGVDWEYMLTWSPQEIQQSLYHIFGDEEIANNYQNWFQRGEYSLGIGELVAAWSEQKSMPRVNYPSGTFRTSFSATHLTCSFGVPLLSLILLGYETHIPKQMELVAIEELREVVSWVKSFLHSLPQDIDRESITACLDWAGGFSMHENILVSWTTRTEKADLCYRVMTALDDEVNTAELVEQSVDLSVNSARPAFIGPTPQDLRFPYHIPAAHTFLKVYSSQILQNWHGEPGPKKTSSEESAQDVALCMVSVAFRTVKELAKSYPEHIVQRVVVNRILRGICWTVHNGNAPGISRIKSRLNGSDRSLECSLSRKWLDTREVICIS